MNISLGVVTNNRPRQLQRLLASIAIQTKRPKTVFVIDTQKESATKNVISQFKNLHIKYISMPEKSVPEARNRGLTECRTSFLGFVDDDCILHTQWVEQAATIVWSKKMAYAIGQSLLSNKHSSIAEAQYIRQTYWVYTKLQSKGKPDPYIFDTKNILLRMDYIRRYRLLFDKTIFIKPYDSSDTDFGFQIHRRGLFGKYIATLKVSHEEQSSLVACIKKAYFRGKLGYLLTQKWHLKGQLTYLPNKKLFTYITQMRFWPNEYRQLIRYAQTISPLKRLYIFFLIKLYDRAYLEGYLHGHRV